MTRRLGWRFLKPGDLLSAVVQSRGLRKGQKVERLATIRVVSVRRERLLAIRRDTDYGLEECRLEGFADHPELQWPDRFAAWFAAGHGCEIDDEVTRIEFEYVG